MSKKDKSPPASKDAGQGKDKKKFPTKLGAIAIIALIALAMMAGSVSAIDLGVGGLYGWSVGSQTKYLTLSQKDPITGEVNFTGAKCDLAYAPITTHQFKVRCYGLPHANTDYTVVLIKPSGQKIALQTIRSDANGYLNKDGPNPYMPYMFNCNGYHIMVVDTAEIGSMAHPENYLYENSLLCKAYPTLNLYEKNQTNWNIIANGAYGKLTYTTLRFDFKAYKLNPNTQYSLVRFAEPWAANDLTILQEGTSTSTGALYLKGWMYSGGEKVWLVLTSDINHSIPSPWFSAWNGAEYLFENNVI